MNKPTVIFHRADFDGLFCRSIAQKFLPDAQLIGWDYGDPLLNFPTSGQVYVLDLSPACFDPGGTFHSGHDRLVWIDHHKTAIEVWPESIPGVRIDGVAACRLAWQWFTNEAGRGDQSEGRPFSKEDYFERRVTEPYAVRLAGEYDIWDKRDSNAVLFQHGLRSRELDDECWRQLLDNSVSPGLEGTGMEHTHSELFSTALLHAGSSVLYAKTQENESIIKAFGFTVNFEGFCLLACNAARYNSQLFTAALKPEHDGCLGFNWDGQQWRVSLYSDKPNIDLSPVAVKYGGGGHRGACGFRVATLPWMK